MKLAIAILVGIAVGIAGALFFAAVTRSPSQIEHQLSEENAELRDQINSHNTSAVKPLCVIRITSSAASFNGVGRKTENRRA